MQIMPNKQQQAVLLKPVPSARLVFSWCVCLLSILLLCVLFERSLTGCAASNATNSETTYYNWCPEKCTCKNTSDTLRTLRVKCGGLGVSSQQRVHSLNELDFAADAPNIIYLELSNNDLSTLEPEVLQSFSSLRRLDLSSNDLHDLDKNSFGTNVLPMERLKLANNSIGHIYNGAFDNLQHLKYLDISQNPLICDCDLMWLLAWSTTHGVKLQPSPKCEAPPYFKGTLLKKLRVGYDLHCESLLQPLLELVPKTNQVVFEGDELVLKCRAPRIAIGVPRDSEDLPPKAHVFWGWSSELRRRSENDHLVFQDPTKVLTDVHLETKHTTDSGILHSILRIEHVTRNHTGLWDCTLRSQQANLSQTVGVIVIAKNTEYCNAVVLHTNKGVYHWPRTIRGEIVQQHCIEESDSTQLATYECSTEGTWINLNTEACAYVSETTRILEQFAKVNLTLTKANALEIARKLHNFTHMQLGKMRDPMDLEFIARTLLNYLQNVRNQPEIAYLLLDIVSELLLLPFGLFYAAQRQTNSSTKLLKAAEWSAAYLQLPPPTTTVVVTQATEVLIPELSLDAEEMLLNPPRNLFIDYFNIRADYFAGISCFWLRTSDDNNPYTSAADSDVKRTFECSTANDTFPLFEQYLDAAIQIPMSLLYATDVNLVQSVRLMVAIYRNAHLLPHLQENRSTSAKTNVLLSSPVIGAQLMRFEEPLSTTQDTTEHYYQALPKPMEMPDLQSFNITDRIMIILRMRPYHNALSAPTPAVWNAELHVWQTQYCQRLYTHRGLLLFSCSKLGYYGLLQRRDFLNVYAHDENAGASFRHAPLGIYVGSTLLFLCSCINLVTYVAFGRAVRINRQQRHSLVNTWLALSMLCLVFTLGIFQTEHYEVCQMCGLLIHYFSLCVLLWLCVSMSALYKRLSKQQRVLSLGGAESVATDHTPIPAKELVKKPILGVYLVGWGIAAIICGISSAVNMREYASYGYCFFQHRNTLNALIVPAAILLGFLFILFFSSYYQLNRRILNALHNSHHHQPQFSDNTQNTENIDLDWLDQSTNHSNTGTSTRRGTRHLDEQYRSLTLSNAISSIVDDYERTQLAHLRAHFLFLCLYVVAWWAAAATVYETTAIYELNVDKPSNSDTHNSAHTYSVIYALACFLLGFFMLLFYTLSRNDTCGEWRKSACCAGTPEHIATASVNGEVHQQQQKSVRKTPIKLYNNNGSVNQKRSHKSGGVTMGVANLTVAYKVADGSIGDAFHSNHSGSRSNSQCSNKPLSLRSIKSSERGGDNATTTQHLLGHNAGVGTSINNSLIQYNNHHHQQQQQRVPNGVNNILMTTQDIPSAEIFYNPNQINVARKFFKKQKRLAKRSNFELQRQLEQQQHHHNNYDDTSDVSSLTGGNCRYANRRHNNAMTLLSGGGRKVNNTNIYYGALRGPSSYDEKHLAPTLLMTPSRLRCSTPHNTPAGGGAGVGAVAMNNNNNNNNNKMVANIYTNIPETSAPQHEVIKMRGSRLGAATPSKLAADVLSEHDEETSSMEEHMPLYENTKQQQHQRLLPALPLRPTPVKTCTPLIGLERCEVAAMNNLGLPAVEPFLGEEEVSLKKDSTQGAGEDEDEKSESTAAPIPLERNDIYISNSLQITDSVNIDETFPMLTLIRGGLEQQQSKSLNNINDIFNINNKSCGAGSGVESVGGVMSATVSTLHPSHSSGNISQQLQSQKKQLQSQNITMSHTNSTSTSTNNNNSPIGEVSSSRSGAVGMADSANNSSSINDRSVGVVGDLFSQRTLSASPTNESDLNYQNSELSIRSHDVYAPQADNELNLTLTDEFQPYLISSNTSEGDDDAMAELNNDDNENILNSHDNNANLNHDEHCIGLMDYFDDYAGSHDALLPATDDEADVMNSSIDELYEAIKRRPILSPTTINYTTIPTTTTTTSTTTLPIIGHNRNNNYQNMQKTDANNYKTTSSTPSTSIQRENLNDTLEDDSSQSSVISYIDPKLIDNHHSSS